MDKAFILLLLSWNASGQLCSSSWSVYKPETSDTNVTLQLSSGSIDFAVKKSIEFRCLNDTVEFNTKRMLSIISISGLWSCSNISEFGSCVGSCDSKKVNISVKCESQDNKTEEHQFSYLNKNCNKLYWSSWQEISNCSAFEIAAAGRSCLDCENNIFPDAQYCNGHENKVIECTPFWSEWGEAEQCTSFNCSSTGQRIRRRKCFYGDGIQAVNSQVCSNESTIMIEHCNVTNTTCSISNASSLPLQAGIGAAVAVGFILILIAFIIIFKRLKNKQPSKELNTSVNLESDQNQSANDTYLKPIYCHAIDPVIQTPDDLYVRPKVSATTSDIINSNDVNSDYHPYNTIDTPEAGLEASVVRPNYDELTV